jgi:hypothetical protein
MTNIRKVDAKTWTAVEILVLPLLAGSAGQAGAAGSVGLPTQGAGGVRPVAVVREQASRGRLHGADITGYEGWASRRSD